MRYLVAEEILAIHDETIETEGGTLGIRDFGLLISITERPKIGMMGHAFYPNLFSKAAAYLEAIATYHVFADGNKRTSILCCSTFLNLNGYELVATNHSVYQFVLSVAQKKKSINEIAAWLKTRSKKLN